MLYFLGVPFSVIAKWIGHKDASVTSTIYGKLDDVELQHMIDNYTTPSFLQNETEKLHWHKVMEHLRNPFTFLEDEWKGFPRSTENIIENEFWKKLAELEISLQKNTQACGIQKRFLLDTES